MHKCESVRECVHVCMSVYVCAYTHMEYPYTTKPLKVPWQTSMESAEAYTVLLCQGSSSVLVVLVPD